MSCTYQDNITKAYSTVSVTLDATAPGTTISAPVQILQFPASVDGFSAQMQNAGASAAPVEMPIQAGISQLQVAPGVTLAAEEGTQLVVADASQLPLGTWAHVALNFNISSGADIPVKVALAAKVTVGGNVYYPLLAPFLPSGGTLAGSPALTIPYLGSGPLPAQLPNIDLTPVQQVANGSTGGSYTGFRSGAAATALDTTGVYQLGGSSERYLIVLQNGSNIALTDNHLIPVGSADHPCGANWATQKCANMQQFGVGLGTIDAAGNGTLSFTDNWDACAVNYEMHFSASGVSLTYHNPTATPIGNQVNANCANDFPAVTRQFTKIF